MSEDNVWREPGVGEIDVGTKRSLMEHREHAFASRRRRSRARSSGGGVGAAREQSLSGSARRCAIAASRRLTWR